jgi:hypothetical protein
VADIYTPGVRIRLPTKLSRDPRHAVTLTEEGTPWPLVFYFLLIVDEDSTEFVNTGFEIGDNFDFPMRGAPLSVEGVPPPVDPITLQRVARNYAGYLDLARGALSVNREEIAKATVRLHQGRRTRRHITDDFLRLIASDYESRQKAGGSPATEIAELNRVNVSTASRWIKTAKKRGFIPEGGPE